MDAVARAEDEGPHLRVPALGLVAEVHARFEKLAHGMGSSDCCCCVSMVLLTHFSSASVISPTVTASGSLCRFEGVWIYHAAIGESSGACPASERRCPEASFGLRGSAQVGPAPGDDAVSGVVTVAGALAGEGGTDVGQQVVVRLGHHHARVDCHVGRHAEIGWPGEIDGATVGGVPGVGCREVGEYGRRPDAPIGERLEPIVGASLGVGGTQDVASATITDGLGAATVDCTPGRSPRERRTSKGW